MILFRVKNSRSGMIVKKKMIIDVVKNGKVVAEIHSTEDGFKIESERFGEVDVKSLKCINSSNPVIFIKF